MAKTVTIGGRDTGRTGSGSGGGKSGGCQDLVGKSATVDKSGNVSWHDGNVSLHGGEERKDGGGDSSSFNLFPHAKTSQERSLALMKESMDRIQISKEQSLLQSLETRKSMGEEYALPYDERGNLLKDFALRDKLEAYMNKQPSSSGQSVIRHDPSTTIDVLTKEGEPLAQKFRDFVSDRIKQNTLENNTIFIPTQIEKYSTTIPKLFLGLDGRAEPRTEKEAQERRDFDALKKQIEETSNLIPIHETEQAKAMSEFFGQAFSSEPKSTKYTAPKMVVSNKELQDGNKELIKNLHERYGEVFVGSVGNFIYNVDYRMGKSGAAVTEDLKAIHFDNGTVGVKTGDIRAMFYGTSPKIHEPVDDNYIAKVVPYLPQFNLCYLSIENSQVGDKGIEALMNANMAVQIWKLNNNQVTDVGAKHIAEAIVSGKIAPESIDLHGNKITEAGQDFFVRALKSEAVNFIAITLESHAGRDAVVDFLKKGSSYYFKEFVKRFKNNIDTQYIKTDEDSAFMHCKEGVPKAVVGVTLGIAKCTNPIAKIINSLPQPGEKVPFVTKAVNKLGLFACVMSEEGDNIVTPDLVGCVTEVNAYLGFGHDDF